MAIARVTGTTPAFPTGNTGNGLGTLSVEFGQVGDLVILNASLSTTDAHIGTVGVSGTGETTAWQLVEASTASGSDVEQWYATVTVVGSASLNVEYSGSSVSGVHIELEADSLRSGLGAATVWQLLTSNTTNNGSSTSVDYPDLTSSGGLAFQAYYGYADLAEEATSSVTSGFTASATSDGNEIILNPSLAAATAYSPVGGQSPAGVSFAIGAIFAVAATAAGSFAFTGTAVGSIIATAAGSFAFTGTAVGSIIATAAGSFAFTGTAVGIAGPVGTGTGSFAFTAAAVGVIAEPYTPPPPPPPPGPGAFYQNLGGLTYKCFDLRSGNYLGLLPLAGVTFGSNLLPGSPGSFSGTIDIADPRTALLGTLSITAPARTLLVVDYLGAAIWAGIVWPRSYQFSNTSRQLTVSATEPWSYFQQRAQATDYSTPPYSGLDYPGYQAMQIWDATNTGTLGVYDPVLIAWQVVFDAATRVSFGNIIGGLGFAANSYTTAASYLASGTATPPGDYLAESYPYPSLQSVDTIVSQIAQNGVGVGFDYGLDVAYGSGGALAATVNLSYPRRGRTYAENQLVVNCGAAISYTPPEDGTQVGNTIYEQGIQGSLVVSQNLNPLDDGYALLEQIKSRANIQSANVLGVLSQLGVADLYVDSYPAVTPSVTLDLFNSSLPLGSFIAGDDVRWIIPTTGGDGQVFDPRFPDGLDEEWRITGWSATVKDEGQSTLAVTLALPPAVEAVGPAI